MKKNAWVIASTALLFAPAIQAATEYLRFEGAISPFYDEYASGYDVALGFQPGQSVYFDFEIDTDLDVGGYPDGSYQNYFAVNYLAGSVSGSAVTRGLTTMFPEGVTTWLYVTNTLRVGTSWDSLGNPSDESIGTWVVGDAMQLMNYSYFSEYSIGSLTLTYRGTTQPSAYVPIPAAAWLLVSGLGLLAAMARRKG